MHPVLIAPVLTLLALTLCPLLWWGIPRLRAWRKTRLLEATFEPELALLEQLALGSGRINHTHGETYALTTSGGGLIFVRWQQSAVQVKVGNGPWREPRAQKRAKRVYQQIVDLVTTAELIAVAESM